MGMYSRVIHHRISVRPGMLRRLKQRLKKRRQAKNGYYYSLVQVKGRQVSLEKLDGHKIISYWYDGFCRFLKDIARYVEGEIFLEFESTEEGPAYLWFQGGKVTIQLPVWYQYRPGDLIRRGRQSKAELDRQCKDRAAVAPSKQSGPKSRRQP